MSSIDTEFVYRFWRKVNCGPSENCWEWRASTTNGYGRIKRGESRALAHRVVHELHTGEEPGDLCVCHHCDNPSCVNPSHLFLGTHSENMKDAYRKGRLSLPEVEEVQFKPGSEPPNKVLTDAEAGEIKEMLLNTSLKHAEIADLYDVPTQTVADISCGRSYVNA